MGEGHFEMKRELGKFRLYVATKIPGYFEIKDLGKFTREAIRDRLIRFYTADGVETSDFKLAKTFEWHGQVPAGGDV